MKVAASCPSCNRKLSVESGLVGKRVKCPVCGNAFAIEPPDAQIPAGQTCPKCGAELQEGAVICVQCGLNLGTGERLGGPSAPPEGPAGEPGGKPVPAGGGPEDRLTPGNAFVHAFIFPFRGHGIMMLITMPVVAALPLFAGLFGLLIYIGMYYGCLIDVMRSAAGGLRFKPEIQLADFLDEMLLPGLKLSLVITIVAVGPLVIAALVLGVGASTLGAFGAEAGEVTGVLFGSAAALGLLGVLVLIAVYLPMSITISGIYNAFVDAINPVVIFRSMARIPGEYALVALFIYALVATSAVLTSAMELLGPAAFLAPAVSFYFSAVAVSRLGFMAHVNRERLGW